MGRWSWIAFLARTFPRPVLVIGGVTSIVVGVMCVVALANQGNTFQWDFSIEFAIPRRRPGAGEPRFAHYSFGQVFVFGMVIATIALILGVTSIAAVIRLGPKRLWGGRHSA